MAYGGSFDVGYNPNMTTRTSLQMPEIPPVEGPDFAGILNALARRRRPANRQMQDLALGQSERPQPAAEDPVRRFMQIKRDLDYIQSRDPWAGRAYGQAQGLEFFNFPAASALAYGKDIFPNGFDTYSNIARSTGGIDQRTQASLGPRQAQTTVQYDPKTGRPISETTDPGSGGWGVGY